MRLLSADNSQPEAKAESINDCSVGDSSTSDWQVIGMPNGLYSSPDARESKLAFVGSRGSGASSGDQRSVEVSNVSHVLC